MAQARARIGEDLHDLLRSDFEEVIEQANLGCENTIIAKRYLLDAIPQIEIAVELGYERSTISKRIPKIVQKIERTAHKLHML